MAKPTEDDLAEVLFTLAEKVHLLTVQRQNEFEWIKAHFQFATKHDLEKMEGRIMSAISDFKANVDAKFDEIGTSVDGIVTDVDFLKKKIEELQNNPGPISPEDQAALDAVQARVTALADKVKALDAATEEPPVPTP